MAKATEEHFAALNPGETFPASVGDLVNAFPADDKAEFAFLTPVSCRKFRKPPTQLLRALMRTAAPYAAITKPATIITGP